MIEALRECRDLLDRAGGHALAAGVSLKAVNIEDFASKLNTIASEIITEEDLVPRIETDGEINPDDINWDLLRDLNRLEPFGQGNPEPLFVSSGLEVLNSKTVGADGSHLKMRVKGDGPQIDCIAFGLGAMQPAVQLGDAVDLCYNIRSNSYNGSDTIQLTVKDIHTVG
jgi:single-stranded-DNA-specific exonuclease